MTKLITPIGWQEQTEPGQPLAPYTLDFSVDPVWQFGLPSFYLQQAITPAGVSVDLTEINTSVTVVSGPLSATVPPYTRQNIPLPVGALVATFTSSGTDQIPIAFYITPPTAAWMNQFAAAVSLANNNIFIGATTTGSANAQTITVSPAATYAFGNGVVIVGTWGFTNTGALTIQTNGGPAIAVSKITAQGPAALTGGEAVVGQNFILTGNIATGQWQLMTYEQALPNTGITLASNVLLAQNAFTTVLSLTLAPGTWQLIAIIHVENSSTTDYYRAALFEPVSGNYLSVGGGTTSGTQGNSIALPWILTVGVSTVVELVAEAITTGNTSAIASLALGGNATAILATKIG